MRYKMLAAFALAWVLLLCGCGEKFDHSAYVKALLDACYKQEFAEYTRLTESTPERAQEQYDENMDTIVGDICGALSVGVTQDNRDRLKLIMEKVLASASYEVAGAEKVSDDEYTVSVKISPITNFLELEDEISAFAGGFIESINDSDYDEMTPEEIYQSFADELTAIFEKGTQTVHYGDEAEIKVSVKLEPEQKKWFIPDGDQEKIFNCIISM